MIEFFEVPFVKVFTNMTLMSLVAEMTSDSCESLDDRDPSQYLRFNIVLDKGIELPVSRFKSLYTSLDINTLYV